MDTTELTLRPVRPADRAARVYPVPAFVSETPGKLAMPFTAAMEVEAFVVKFDPLGLALMIRFTIAVELVPAVTVLPAAS